MATIFSHAASGHFGGGVSPYSYRNTLAITGGALTQVRVTFVASDDLGLDTTHCSIGISTTPNNDPSGSSTTATPTELLFSAASGFSIAAGASITSDWVNFNGFTGSDKLVVILDTTGALIAPAWYASGTNAAQLYYGSGQTSWNTASDPGFTNSYGNDAGVSLIETQSVGGGAGFFNRQRIFTGGLDKMTGGFNG